VSCTRMRSGLPSTSRGVSSLESAMGDCDAPGLVSDTRLIRRGRVGERRGDFRSRVIEEESEVDIGDGARSACRR